MELTKPKTVHLGIKIEPAFKEKLSRIAKRNKRSMSQQIILMLTRDLKNEIISKGKEK